MSRRRKSRQRSSSKSKVGHIVSVTVGAILLFIVLGIVGGYLWLTHFLQSEKFRTMVNERASEATGTQVEVSRFAWDGMVMRVPVVEVKGEDLIQQARIEGVETEVDLGSLLRKQFESSEIQVRELNFVVDVTKDLPEMSAPTGEVTFPGILVDDCNARISFGGPELVWEGTRVELSKREGQESYDIFMRGGQVTTPIGLFPSGKLREVKARYGAGSLFLTQAEFGVYESGRLNLTGEVGMSGGEYSLDGQLRDVFGREMVPENWKKRLEGTLESDFTVRGSGRSPEVTGDLVMVDGVLTGLPIFDRIAAYADTTRFRRLVLNKAQLKYRQDGMRLELREILLASDGLMRVEGQLDLESGNLNGNFRLGLTPGILSRIPGAETIVFHPGEEGLLWTTVRVTGTLEDPKEDLSRRLIAAAGARMFEVIPETGERVLRFTGAKASEMALQILQDTPDLTEKGVEVIEQGTDVIRAGTDLLRDGADSALNLFPGFGGSRESGEEEGEAEE